MKIYLVGGALRDKFLNIPIKDKDYVVVGSTPEEMVKKGFKPIGKDFPVFIHPDTKDEYALARTEKKIGIGYHGFKFYSSPKVNLVEDLKRRDLTINAIAQDEDGNIYDPYNGQIDIEKRILRHVSDAFIEDPLRVLRVARFSTLDEKFVIHKDTLNLLKKRVLNEELKSLAIERVVVEIKKGLEGKKPSQMFRCLCECEALNQILPGINPNKKTNSVYVELGLLIEKNIVNIAPDNKFLLILLIPFFSKNFSSNKINYSKNQEKNLLEHLGLSKSQNKLYESLKSEKENIESLIEVLDHNGIKMFVITDISKDGMMDGINETSINSILKYITTNAIISGGVTTIDDVKTILAMNKSRISGMIIGKALYENKIKLSEAINECS